MIATRGSVLRPLLCQMERRLMRKTKKAAARPKTKRGPALNPKQAHFVKVYLANGKNATQAAIAAGYSKKTAEQLGFQLLQKTSVSEAIEAELRDVYDRLGITLENWLSEYWGIATSDISDHIEIDELTGSMRHKGFAAISKAARRSLESVTEVRTIHESANGKQCVVNSRITFKMHPKVSALRDIGEHRGWLKKNPQVDLPGVEKAIYELSDKFLPAVSHGADKSNRGHAKR